MVRRKGDKSASADDTMGAQKQKSKAVMRPSFRKARYDSQADRVAAAYRRCGLALSFRIDRGAWPTLTMRKRRSTGWR